METKETKYYAIYDNGNYVEKPDLNSVIELKGYKYLIQKKYHHEYIYNKDYPKYYFQYTSIDENGKEKPLIFGNFECLDLGLETGTSYHTGTISKVLDVRRNTVHDITSSYKGIDFFNGKLIPIINKLIEVGNWESYQILKENERLADENTLLNQKIEELKAELANKSIKD